MAETVYREDYGSSVTARIDENGYLRVEGVAAKEGVMTYMRADGTVIREFVPASTLEDAEALDVLIGSPVTVEHPGILDSNTAPKFAKGSVTGAGVESGRLNVRMTVTAQDAIDEIQRGKRHLSPGYRAEVEMKPGVWNGIEYDAVQTRRYYNHLAIVDQARGGTECQLRLDSLRADGVDCAVEVPTNHQPTEVNKMPSVKLSSGATVEVADASTASAIQAEINALAQRADAAQSMVDKAKYDELQGKYDALKEEMEKIKSAQSEKMDADEIGEFLEVVESARKLKPELEIKQDGKYLTTSQIMAAAIGVDVEGKSEEYLKGRFDAAVELAGKEVVAKQRQVHEKHDASDVPLTGREKFIREQLKRRA